MQQNLMHATLKNPNIKKKAQSVLSSNKINELDSSAIFNAKFLGPNENLKPFLLSGQQQQQGMVPNQFVDVPELNHSLLLADLISRSVTGNKYKSAIDESLYSPQDIVLQRINEGIVQNEEDMQRNLSNLFLEVEVNTSSSWLGKMRNYVETAFQYIGVIKKEDMDDYVQDVKSLFQ
ncbi:uncharacterized protein CDAR_606311 [Caerostris darwini]|uniref:Vitellogenin n=1 Tax=Caerostris darwini TaxID=1538125 RepID=A0AAV4PDG2_9ARAC|nr:uncharacterized protein CDAR_606311 [Caerostris darwini]